MELTSLLIVFLTSVVKKVLINSLLNKKNI